MHQINRYIYQNIYDIKKIYIYVSVCAQVIFIFSRWLAKKEFFLLSLVLLKPKVAVRLLHFWMLFSSLYSLSNNRNEAEHAREDFTTQQNPKVKKEDGHFSYNE